MSWSCFCHCHCYFGRPKDHVVGLWSGRMRSCLGGNGLERLDGRGGCDLLILPRLSISQC